MKEIEVSYWLLKHGRQHIICEIDSNQDIWSQILSQVRHDVDVKGNFTMDNVSDIQIGRLVE